MDQTDLRTLKILEEVEKEKPLSQRGMAKELNISLGLVNSFIKRMAHKGYFKISNIPKNRVKYILTPKGVAKKARLTYKYIKHSFEFYKYARQNIKILLGALESNGVKKIIFYGASDLAEIAYLSLKETQIQLVGVVDDLKKNKKFLGRTVENPEIIKTIEYDIILITTIGSQKEILNKIMNNGIDQRRIVNIDQNF